MLHCSLCALIGQDVWQQVREGQIDPLTLREMLESIRKKADVPLSVRSLHFLSLDANDMDDFVQLHKQQPIKRQVTPVVTPVLSPVQVTLSLSSSVLACSCSQQEVTALRGVREGHMISVSVLSPVSDRHHLHQHLEEEHGGRRRRQLPGHRHRVQRRLHPGP